MAGNAPGVPAATGQELHLHSVTFRPTDGQIPPQRSHGVAAGVGQILRGRYA
jgi:hypothetical protein